MLGNSLMIRYPNKQLVAFWIAKESCFNRMYYVVIGVVCRQMPAKTLGLKV